MAEKETPGMVNIEDMPIFPGGPSKKQVEVWKTQYPKVVLSDFGDDGRRYIWHTVDRMTWKQISGSLSGAEKDFFEEQVFSKVLLFPKLDHMGIQRCSAGDPSTVVEQFLAACGFGTSQVTEL